MSENVNIRRARLEDANAIVELWMEMMGEHEQFEPNVNLAPDADKAYLHYASHHILHDDSIVVVAERNKRVVGYCLAFVTKNLPMFLPEYYGYLSDVTVQARMQQKGVGQSLFKRVTEWLRARGIANLQLQVYHRNELGRKFWDKVGCDNFVRGLWYNL